MSIPLHALILERSEYAEADRLLTVYSLEEGRVRLLAKGVRRTLSTRKAALELFTRAALLITESQSLPLVQEASIIESYPRLKGHLPRVLTAHHIAEVVLRTTAERDPQPAVYHLLEATFRHLDRDAAPRLTLEAFRVKYLAAVGLAPELERCVHCDALIEPGAHTFGAHGEGVECAACRTPDSLALPLNVLKLLRLFEKVDYATAGRVTLEPADARAIRSFTQRLVELQTQKELKSTRFLE